MAKRLLLNFLLDYIGEYVDGLSRDNLKMGVWSGEIEFHNLTLKPSALAHFNFPVNIEMGEFLHYCWDMSIPTSTLCFSDSLTSLLHLLSQNNRFFENPPHGNPVDKLRTKSGAISS